MIFLWPLCFLLLIPYVLLLFFFKKKKAFPFSSVEAFSKVTPSLKVKLSFLPQVLLHFSFIFLVIALARPQERSEMVQRQIKGLDIMIVLDVSESMLIEDMKPQNRLEASKLMIEEFIKKKVSARIGLVVFSGESFSPVPMTLDYPFLIQKLKEVNSSIRIKQGTAIGLSLLNAVDRLKNSKAKTRVVIFLTDGENNSGNIAPEVALDIAQKYDLKIYTIAMGKAGPARIPTYMKVPGGKVIKRYRPYVSRVNKGLLKKMADTTDGRFFEAQDSSVLREIFKTINSLEKSKIKVENKIRIEEKFHKFLLFSFFLYLISFLLQETVFRRLS